MEPISLAVIPRELLFIIFSYLYPSHLSTLCYSRALSNVARDLLYRRFSGDSRNIMKFLRTIIDNPTLASRVRHVYLDQLHTTKDSKLPKGCVSRFTAAIRDLPVSESFKSHWIDRMTQGHKEASAALLLAYLPRLTTLEIWTQDQYARSEYGAAQFLLEGQPFWTVLMPESGSATLQTPFLKNVRTLNLLSLPCSVCDLARVFTLPALRSLHIWDVVDTKKHREIPRWAFKPFSNKISRLELTSASITMVTLQRMLLSCSVLESFAYNCPIPPPNLNFPSLIDVISTSRKTLKSLMLLDQNAWSHEVTSIHSLAGLTSLEHFSGDAAVLFGEMENFGIFDVLPQSLSQLHLKDMPSSVIDKLGGPLGILKRLSESSSLLPRLRKVSMVRSSSSFSDEDFGSEIYLHNGLELCIQGRMAYDLDPYE